MRIVLKYSGNHEEWYSDGNKLGAVLCVQVTGHILAAQLQWQNLLGHSNLLLEQIISKTIEVSMSCLYGLYIAEMSKHHDSLTCR